MVRKTTLYLLLALAGCDYCVEDAQRALGQDAICSHAASNTVVCYSRSRNKSYVCMSASERGQVVCIEGLGPQAEASK